MKVSFIIVNWNTRDLAAQAVDSILRFEPGPDREIILVDNGSTDGSAGLLKDRFAGITVIANQENVGFARANNLGAAVASGDWILLFNSDAYLTQPVVATMLRAAEGIGLDSILTCRLKYPDGSDQLCAMAFPTLTGLLREVSSDTDAATRRMLAVPESHPDDTVPVDWVTGAFLMVPRKAYLELGGLDASIFMYAEDMDFCRKAAARGIKSHQVKSVSAVHIGGGSVDYQSARALRLSDQGRLAYFRRWHGRGGAFALRVIFLYRSLARALVFTASGILHRDGKAFARAGIHLRGVASLLGFP